MLMTGNRYQIGRYTFVRLRIKFKKSFESFNGLIDNIFKFLNYFGKLALEVTTMPETSKGIGFLCL